MELGESLVGAYLRHIVGCEVVVFNSFFADRQGEIDVVGVKAGSPRTAYLCEVTTHIHGMQIVRKGKNATTEVVPEKLERLVAFASTTFPDEQHRFEWWSPRVAKGHLTSFFEQLVQQYRDRGTSLEFVINETYTERIRELAKHARRNSSTTNEPAYRMLQLLTTLRGSDFSL